MHVFKNRDQIESVVGLNLGFLANSRGQRHVAGSLLMRRSPMYTSPLVILSRPAIILSVVVLPQPLGPTRTTNSLSRMDRLKLSTDFKR